MRLVKLPENPAFDAWCYTAIDETRQMDGGPVPVITTLLYAVCGGDQVKFHEGIALLRAAFEAGQKARPE